MRQKNSSLVFTQLFLLLINSASTNALEQKILENSLHSYYQLNININRYWQEDTNLAIKRDTERTLALMRQAMDELVAKDFPGEEYQQIKTSWHTANAFIEDNSLLEKGYSDVSLIASYRVYLDKVRIAMLKQYHSNPPSSNIANLLILFDRIISTYVEVNTDAFGSFIRSANDDDVKLAAIANEIDQQLLQLYSANEISKSDLHSIKVKWNFIRRIVADSHGQASPFIVLLNGRKIIQIFEKYN